LLLEFYLSPNNAHHWADIQALATSDSPDSLENLRKYALEGFRLNPPAAGAFRIIAAPITLTSKDKPSIHPGVRSTVLIDLKSAGVDAAIFPNPLEVRLDRKDSLYAYLGYGEHLFLEQNTMMKIMAAQLAVFARLKNLRRAAGPPG
jgi:cytochrome P450